MPDATKATITTRLNDWRVDDTGEAAAEELGIADVDRLAADVTVQTFPNAVEIVAVAPDGGVTTLTLEMDSGCLKLRARLPLPAQDMDPSAAEPSLNTRENPGVELTIGPSGTVIEVGEPSGTGDAFMIPRDNPRFVTRVVPRAQIDSLQAEAIMSAVARLADESKGESPPAP